MRGLRALAALLDPIGAVPRAVDARAFLVPLLVTMALTVAGATTVAVRLDASRLVLPRLEASGELGKASEREIGEQIEQAQRVAIVGAVAKGVLGVPMLTLLAALAVWLISWAIGGKAAFAEIVTVVSLAALPLGVGQGVTALVAAQQTAIAPSATARLVPSSLEGASIVTAPVAGWKLEGLRALASLVDFFHLWSALLLGLGLAAATKRSRWVATPVGVALYFLVIAAVTVGLPGLGNGSGGGGR